jgi:hypothetical protein
MDSDPVTVSHIELDQPTTEVHSPLVAVTGENCPACGAHMAADQRYCLECGQRRGETRLPIVEGLRQRNREDPPPPARRRPRLTANGTLIAGVGTLLLAMGIGVLIGRTANTPTSGKSGVQVVTVGGGGATATGAAANAASGKGAKSKKSAKAAKANPGAVYKNTKLPPPVVKLGSPGKGRGYTHGKFTGDFFGPGQ